MNYYATGIITAIVTKLETQQQYLCAGIGGLTLAIALQRLGIEVEIYEKASKLQPIGWGLALAPNALLALSQIDYVMLFMLGLQ